MRFFSCSVCSEKEARIRDLQEQIRYLRDLAIPENSTTKTHVNVVEADAVLSATDHIIEIPDPKLNAAADLEKREREQLLAGTY